MDAARGGVREHEDLDQAARRVLAEKTRLRQDDLYLEQLGGYGAAGRKSRMSVVTVAYLAVCADIGEEGHLVRVEEIEQGILAFDHARIARDALERVSSKLERTIFATIFLPAVFTIAEVREVYEAVWNTSLHKGNFQRSFRKNAESFVRAEPTDQPERRPRRGRRPQQWWSLETPYQRGQPVGLLEHALAHRRQYGTRGPVAEKCE